MDIKKRLSKDGEKLLNIDIFSPTKRDIATLKEVLKLNIYSLDKNFEEEGLFSTTIFGPVGSSVRNETFGYIDLGIKLLHPLIYQHIMSLGVKYKDIIYGNKKAVWNEETNDFNIVEEGGQYGLMFFIKHMDKLNLVYGDSDQRNSKITMVKSYGREYDIRYMLVLPAGLRDYFEKDGKGSEDEVNDIYRAIIGMANNLKSMNPEDEEDLELLNPIIVKIQEKFLEVYEYFKTILSGKKGVILSMWAKTAVMGGTRNVITPSTKLIEDLDSIDKIGFNDTTVGLYQYISGISPIAKNRIKTIFMDRVINSANTEAYMFNKNFEKESITILPKDSRKWLTYDGMTKVISSLGQESTRYAPVTIGGYYPILVDDNNGTVKVYFPGDEVVKTKTLRPISYMELMYLAVYDVRKKYPCEVVRFPVTGVGSSYISNVYLKTTVTARTVKVIMDGIEKEVFNYPILSERPYNSCSVNYSRLGPLGADHDGDQISVNFIMLDEPLEEARKLFEDLKYYISPDGKLTYSCEVDPNKFLMLELTMDEPYDVSLSFKKYDREVIKNKNSIEKDLAKAFKGTGSELSKDSLKEWSKDKFYVIKHNGIYIGCFVFNYVRKGLTDEKYLKYNQYTEETSYTLVKELVCSIEDKRKEVLHYIKHYISPDDELMIIPKNKNIEKDLKENGFSKNKEVYVLRKNNE